MRRYARQAAHQHPPAPHRPSPPRWYRAPRLKVEAYTHTICCCGHCGPKCGEGYLCLSLALLRAHPLPSLAIISSLGALFARGHDRLDPSAQYAHLHHLSFPLRHLHAHELKGKALVTSGPLGHPLRVAWQMWPNPHAVRFLSLLSEVLEAAGGSAGSSWAGGRFGAGGLKSGNVLTKRALSLRKM